MTAVFKPRLIVCPDAASAAVMAAERVATALDEGRVLGLATGATMVPLYAALRERLGGSRLSHGGIVGIALDEYVGLSPGHPAGFSSYLDQAVATPLGLSPGQIVVPDGVDPDRLAAAARHEAAIASAGGIYLQLLGLGTNGHIGFNEPGSTLDSRTRDVTLAEDTRLAQIEAFGTLENVPASAITSGIATILGARHLLMLVTGQAKAAALSAALDDAIGPDCPASALRLHPSAVVICDPAAATLLRNRSANDRMAQTC